MGEENFALIFAAGKSFSKFYLVHEYTSILWLSKPQACVVTQLQKCTAPASDPKHILTAVAGDLQGHMGNGLSAGNYYSL